MDRDVELVPVRFPGRARRRELHQEVEALQISYRTIYVNLRRPKY